MYPHVEPYERGLLDVGDGHRVYWERCGNPNGKPALNVHGGPGSSCSEGARRFFNPDEYDAILFDQRGCGRSLPLLQSRSELTANTTQHLIEDIEKLRTHLSIDRWLLAGGSWGTTLALAYAQQYPERVTALVLGSPTTSSRRDIEWITEGVGRLFPQEWETFSAFLPDRLKTERIVDAYAELLFDPDQAVAERAASHWCAWEDAIVSLVPGHEPNAHFVDPAFCLRFARLVTHYWRNGAFLEEDQILRNVGSLKGIPGILIHGLYDVSTPLDGAWKLHRAWPGSELRVVRHAGHAGMAMALEMVQALDRYASLVSP